MITAQDVNSLRQQTGVGIMDCKKALLEAEGNVEKAIELLRKRGQKISAERAQRETTEGIVLIKHTADNTQAFLLAIACETDFVSRSDAFTTLAQQIIQTATQQQATTTQEVLDLVIDNLTINQHLEDLIAKVGEKIHIIHYQSIQAPYVASYTHADKVGVLLALTGGNPTTQAQVGKDLAMQVAAMNPIAVDQQDIDPTTLEKEKEIGRTLASKQNKPPAVLDKIAEGYVKKFVKTNTLLHQPYVKDNALSVLQYINQVDNTLSVQTFIRISIAPTT